jgi:D-alanyl-D-alanine carboxypeptidase (penicillin-binding protein 5/6)
VSLTAKRGNSRFVSVVLGAENSDIRFADGRRLLDYGFANYSSVMLASKGESFGQVRVHGGSRESVDAIVEMEAGLTLPKGEDSGIAKQVALRTDMVAPVRKGDKVGDLVVTRAGKEIDRIPLVAREDVRKAPFWIFVPRVFMEITRLRW